MKVVVYVEGGIVQSVATDSVIEVLVVDYDTENNDSEDVTVSVDGNSANVWLATNVAGVVDPLRVAAHYEAYEATLSEED